MNIYVGFGREDIVRLTREKEIMSKILLRFLEHLKKIL
jgi:hypothetical protein